MWTEDERRVNAARDNLAAGARTAAVWYDEDLVGDCLSVEWVCVIDDSAVNRVNTTPETEPYIGMQHLTFRASTH